ncbi:3'-5' exonuclease KapD [Mesobacillus foraminis]|jgi:sporulation inhibitor KapD|uniref:Sporulation inhibitor KapD n=1 Tax=Mesobacillus foraminis TaxID=279826 RepID=A0A4R2B541_9BACI|nr:3'-5' exonuclease KapD [Mesobacillus foraminis]TCN21353.1 sporulation inhibitor KapD [Mesobacillus foraminis]
MKEKKRAIFIDFEFTMPDRHGRRKGFYQEIIEAGIVLVENGQIVEQFSSYVAPIRFPVLSERCKSFLNITQEQVDTGISFQELVNRLGRMGQLPASIITWGNMDMKVLRHNCQQAGLPFPLKGAEVDLSMEYKRFFGDQNQTGLWKAVQEYGREGTGRHHRALDDALTTYHIYKLVEKDKQYLERPKPTTIGDRVDFSKLLNKFA